MTRQDYDCLFYVLTLFALIFATAHAYNKGITVGRKEMLTAYEKDQARCNCCHSAMLRATLQNKGK